MIETTGRCAAARAAFAAAVLAEHADAAAGAVPAPGPTEQAHIAGCAACRAHFEDLARAVLSMAPDAISCAECTARLGDYVAADLDGAAAAVALPRVHGHLATCRDCEADYRAARAAVVDARLGRLPDPPRAPRLDLSFLDRAATRPAALPAARWAEPGRWARRTVALLVIIAAVLVARERPGGAPRDDARGAGTVAPRATGAAAAHGATAVARADTPPLAAVPPTPAAARSSPPPARAAAIPTAVGVPTATPPATATDAPAATTTPAPPDTATAVTATAAMPPETRRPERTAPPSGTPTPQGSPTPMLVWRCEPAFPSMLRILAGTCAVFPNTSEYDVFRLAVTARSRWTVSLCNRTELDTVVALYRDGAFDPAAPCGGILAFNDDHCDRQSRLTVDLDPGVYALVIAEKTGDVGAPYAFKLETDEAVSDGPCAERLAP